VTTEDEAPAAIPTENGARGVDLLTAALAHAAIAAGLPSVADAATLAWSLDVKGVPASVRAELATRLTEAEGQLRDLGIDPYVWWKLVPFVGWTPAGPSVDHLSKDVEYELVQTLGEPVAGPDYLATKEERDAEAKRLMVVHGADHDTAQSAALSTLYARHLERLLGHSTRLMREPVAWEAVKGAAFAAAALLNPTPEALSALEEYFERLDDARQFDAKKSKLGRYKAGASYGGREAKKRQPARTLERNEQMKADYIVARMHDGMKMPEATKYLATKNGLEVAQVCRIIKPRALEPEIKALLANLRPS
jgi:hypothetical protein